MRTLRSLLSAGLVLVAAARSAGAGIEYEVLDLGTLPGHDFSRAMEINDGGQVAGYSGVAGVPSSEHALRYTDGTGLLDLGTLGGSSSRAYGINASGQVAGYSLISNSPPRVRAFRYTSGAGLLNLGDLGTAGGSYGYDINDAGQVVGHAFWNSYQFAVRYTDGQGLVPLGPLVPHETFWSTYGVNSAGRGAGVVSDIEVTRGFRTDAAWLASGSVGDLGGEESWVYAINDAGHVVGTSRPTAAAGGHAFLKNGDMQDLGTLGGLTSTAYDINADDEVVGSSEMAAGAVHAFLWTAAQGMIDLNDLIDPGLGWELEVAHGIDELGRVVGWGRHAGQERAFRLTPLALGQGPGEVHGIRVVDYDNPTRSITIAFGTACRATDSAAVVGSLTHAQLASYTYTERACDLGNNGAASFVLPSGSVFFLIVANDDLVEGSYGLGNGGERPEQTGAPCDVPQQLAFRCDATR